MSSSVLILITKGVLSECNFNFSQSPCDNDEDVETVLQSTCPSCTDVCNLPSYNAWEWDDMCWDRPSFLKKVFEQTEHLKDLSPV